MIDSWPKAIDHIGARLAEPAERKWRRETIETWTYHRKRAVKARSPEERFYAGNIAAIFDGQFIERGYDHSGVPRWGSIMWISNSQVSRHAHCQWGGLG